jgi:hypothetical protein
MKPALLTIFLLLTTIATAGPVFRIETGPAIGRNIYFYDTTAGYRFRFYGLTSFTSGGILTWAYYNGSTGSPFESIYYLQQQFNYKNLFIKMKHHCSHRVESGPNYTADWWAGDITTVSIGYEIEVK